MAFLDNSGDIILDAVLTDTGRMRLARGDGSFKIMKFALGDDEIKIMPAVVLIMIWRFCNLQYLKHLQTMLLL